ncbi:hypothetical protein [Litoribacterium kuwaitense]|uniref:hypothetical protein n=1 Tax=Litoribacterium kuwaitense TaxID=1398745 RepID=UPI001FE8F0CD|nr:hypothetical protein [Litoribacterium kuwaitense]
MTYEQDEEGNFVYLDTITDNPDGLNIDQAVSQYLTWPGGYYPGIVKEEFFQGAEAKENSANNAEQVKPYRIKDEDILPPLSYTVEENEQVSTILSDINTYVDEMEAAFITGEQDFSQWEDYKKTLEQMGVQEYLDIAQTAYERSQENS